MEFSIRSAAQEDFPSIYPLFGQLWPNKELNQDALRAVYSRGVSSQTDALFCAVLDGEIVGFCAYAIVNNLWQEGQIAYVYAMVLDERCRGKGYGTKLLQTAVDTARRQGMKRMELDSAFHREAAHRFYEKFGFEKRAYLFSYPL